jgi:hypothetical protein
LAPGWFSTIRLPHGFAQAVAERARDQVDRAAHRLRQNEADRL